MSPVSTLPTASTPAPAQPDLEQVKAKQQAMWASGDFGQIGVRLQVVGESLCEAAGVGAPDKVLDVAAGNGNASLAAARRFADVTSTDYVPALLEHGACARKPIGFLSPSRWPTRRTCRFPTRRSTRCSRRSA